MDNPRTNYPKAIVSSINSTASSIVNIGTDLKTQPTKKYKGKK